MPRIVLLAGFALLASSTLPARANDLPVGKWSVAIAYAGLKGDLVIKEVGRDGKVTATLLGNPAEGTWDGATLTLKSGQATLEAALVTEVTEKGEKKHTLTGFHRVRMANLLVAPPAEFEVKSGWYAQKVEKEDDRIKAEVRGTVVCKDTTEAYVRVYRDEGFGLEEEIRIHFRLSEGEWKHWKNVLPKLNGQTVTVTGAIGQIPKREKTSLPAGTLYFAGGFSIKTATETFK